jgi:hypothetical protein
VRELIEYLDTGKVLAKGVEDEDIMFARPGPTVEYCSSEFQDDPVALIEAFVLCVDEPAAVLDVVRQQSCQAGRARRRSCSAPFLRPTPQCDSWRHDRGRIVS